MPNYSIYHLGARSFWVTILSIIMANINDEESEEKKLRDLRQKEEEDVAQILAGKYGLQYVDLTMVPINPETLRLVEEANARTGKLVVFGGVGKKINIAVVSPSKEETVEKIRELEDRGYSATLFLASPRSLEHAWDRYKDIGASIQTKAGMIDISSEEIVNLMKDIKTIGDVKGQVEKVLAEKKSFRISRILEIIMAGGIVTSASDIHLEPEEKYIRMRYRLDGILVDIIEFNRETYELLLSRVKLLSGMKLNIKNNAQDGRFSVSLDKLEIEIRVSVLPGDFGESIVMRLLNPQTIAIPMESLGFEPHLMKVLQEQIARPNGMILTTGPTGSGKTTTLYAFLRKIENPETKIITIEDPIEYHLEGIVQTQVSREKGYDFGSGLRSILRQDPDVIMVGEIRDEETAEIAINSALTGHLVFSTLHTNNAAGTFPRLIDLGVNPKVLSSAINISLAQRLVRVLCSECKKEVVPTAAEKEKIDRILKTIKIPEYAQMKSEKIWQAVGCAVCHDLGFKGRIGICEGILMNNEIEKVVRENPSEREIAAAAEDQGLLNMQQDGVVKVLKGVTTLDELERVIDLT